MFLLHKPNENTVRRFITKQKSTQFSYSDRGLSRSGIAPHGYVLDYIRVRLDTGPETFRRATRAVQEWKMFPMPWVQLCWPDAPISANTNVAILISHFGFCSLNAARIVYLVEDHGSCEKYGFAYGTLPEHGESGEERFTVEFHSADESVWYDLFAFSRPNTAARIAPLSSVSQLTRSLP